MFAPRSHQWWNTGVNGSSIFTENVEDHEDGEIEIIKRDPPVQYLALEEKDLFEVKLDRDFRIRKEVLSVVTNMVDSVALFQEERNLDGVYPIDGEEEQELSQKKIYMKMLEVGKDYFNGCLDIQCERCLTSRGTVRRRGISWYGYHIPAPIKFIDDLEIKDLQDPEGGAELVCRSCTFNESEWSDESDGFEDTGHEWCMCCGLCDGLNDRQGVPLRGTFIHTPRADGDEIRCYECHASHLEEFSMAIRGTEVCYDYEEPCVICSECGIECHNCESCEHVAAANTPLMINYDEETHGIVCDECGGFTSWDCVCRENNRLEWGGTFDGEFENVEMPENNSERAKEIKDVIKELGEEMYDLQETLSEGQYLKMMNLLQKITNKVNAL